MSALSDALDEVVLRFGEINANSGYNYTVQENSWKYFRLPHEVPHHPVVFVFTDRAQALEGQYGERQRWNVPTIAVGYVKSSTFPGETAYKFLSDMKKALSLHRSTGAKDWSLGGNCDSIYITNFDVVGNIASDSRTIELGWNMVFTVSIDSL